MNLRKDIESLAYCYIPNEKPILWFLFGLVAHLFAALIFLALKIYEKNVTSTDK